MLTYALTGRVVSLILILLKCLLQRIQQQQAATEAAPRVVMTLPPTVLCRLYVPGYRKFKRLLPHPPTLAALQE